MNWELFFLDKIIFFFGTIYIFAFMSWAIFIVHNNRPLLGKWFVFYIVLAVMLFTGMESKKYVIRDYVETKEYRLLVNDGNLFFLDDAFQEVNYEDFWNDMGDYIYWFEYEHKLIFMSRERGDNVVPESVHEISFLIDK